MNYKNVALHILAAVALLAIGFGLGIYGQHGANLGAVVYESSNLVGDVYQGMSNTKIFTGGNFVGPIVTSQSAAFSGTVSSTGYTYLTSPVLSTGQTTLTASATTTTLTSAQICAGGGVVKWTPTTNNTTATLPTTASLVTACLPTAGESISVQFISGAATNTYNLVAGTGQTIYHINEVATTTSQGTTVVSSTPIRATFQLTLASGTDSTANVYFTKFLTP